MKNNKKILIIIALLLIIIILLYFLVSKIGNIENNGPLIPTGNIDIFEIYCNENCDCEKSQDAFKEDGFNTDKSNPGKELIVRDDDALWNNRELRIFSNPAYEYESIIAPGSKNSYTFIVRNNNAFDIIVDIVMTEENSNDINMKYKLKSKGVYLAGNETTYEDIDKLNIKKILIPAKSQKSYILDWKWVDDDNDTEIGVDIDVIYKLIINIGVKSV